MAPKPLLGGETPPSDGRLPASAFEGGHTRTWGLYVHIPFCAVRCGYCDFNTYTSDELEGVSQETFPGFAAREMDFAHQVMSAGGQNSRPLRSVFFGGGTPTLLGPKPLLALLDKAKDVWGLDPGVEVTVEANPDSVTPQDLAALKAGGVTRLSLGVQSTDPEVLATLDRTHNAEQVPRVIDNAREVGLEVSIDLIFGTPGETLAQWQNTLQDALEWQPDHVSAYSLIVEPGTALARRINRGELAGVDDDVQADMYGAAEDALSDAGYDWYEISNWSKHPSLQSVHNRSYWTTEDWWGIGPGAHSHVGGVRWWNVKHPAAYTKRISEGVSPALAREILTNDQQRVEQVLLGLRMRDGVPRDVVDAHKAPLIADFIGRGLLDGRQALAGRLVLTNAGRLVADHLVRELT
jgi:putative oxygen-independent coproporphyrinogen III oxidase